MTVTAFLSEKSRVETESGCSGLHNIHQKVLNKITPPFLITKKHNLKHRLTLASASTFPVHTRFASIIFWLSQYMQTIIVMAFNKQKTLAKIQNQLPGVNEKVLTKSYETDLFIFSSRDIKQPTCKLYYSGMRMKIVLKFFRNQNQSFSSNEVLQFWSISSELVVMFEFGSKQKA